MIIDDFWAEYYIARGSRDIKEVEVESDISNLERLNRNRKWGGIEECTEEKFFAKSVMSDALRRATM
jgi:hypothetical protein